MSTNVKIAFFETTREQEKYIKNKYSTNNNLFFSRVALGEDKKFLEKVYDAQIICVFIGSLINESVIKSFNNLKAICTMSTGFDHINIEFAKSKNISIYTVPTYGQNTVAQHAMALILAISRKLIPSNEKIKVGKFDSENICGFDLKNKNIAIIGCGNIGKHLAKMCYGFEMNIYIYDEKIDEKIITEIGAKYVSLKDAIQSADIISMHLPLTNRTQKIINKEAFSLMKKGVVIINTARGGLIDSVEMYKALIEKRIGAVGMDVFEEETFFKDDFELVCETPENKTNFKTILVNNLLIHHPRVIATPHNAFNSKEAIERILDTTIANINSSLQGNAENRVN